MHQHLSLYDRLTHDASEGNPPQFVAGNDPILSAFGRIFVDSELYSLDATALLDANALTPIVRCSTGRRRTSSDEIETFVCNWTPVGENDDPVTGFRTGHNSAYLGTTPTIAMPQDERTASLLLLVTSNFVHLSGVRDEVGLTIRGARHADGSSGYRYLELAPAAVATLI